MKSRLTIQTKDNDTENNIDEKSVKVEAHVVSMSSKDRMVIPETTSNSSLAFEISDDQLGPIHVTLNRHKIWKGIRSNHMVHPLLQLLTPTPTPRAVTLLEELRMRKDLWKEVLEARDPTSGVGAIHLALLLTPDHYEIMELLMNSCKQHLMSEFQKDQQTLEVERRESILELQRKGMASKLVAVNDWFEKETEYRRRVLEFDAEKWWTSILTSKDVLGRTPLHFAAMLLKTPKDITSLTHGRGVFLQNDLKPDDSSSYCQKTLSHIQRHMSGVYLKPNMIYNSLTGGTAASLDKNDEEDFSKYILLSESGDMMKSDAKCAIVSQADDILYTNYEIVVPWVMRNMIRRASELAKKKEETAISVLESMIGRLTSLFEGRSKYLLLLAELKIVLEKLGIQVTKDILKEICRMYPADLQESNDKFKLIKVSQELQERIQFFHDNDYVQWNCHNQYSESKAASYDDKMIDADSKCYNVSEKSSNGAKFSPSLDKGTVVEKWANYQRNNIWHIEDEGFGLSVEKFLQDLKNGRGLRSLDHRLQKKLDFDEGSRRNKGEPKEHNESACRSESSDIASCTPLKADKELKSISKKYSLRSDIVVGPSDCNYVSLSSIQRTRRNVLNMLDISGNSALIIASLLGNKDCVAFLLSHGADISIQNLNGQSALSVAKNRSVRSLLEKNFLLWLNRKKMSETPYPRLSHQKLFGDEEKEQVTKDTVEVLRVNDTYSISGGEGQREGENVDISSDEANLDGDGKYKMSQRSKLILSSQREMKRLQECKWAYSRSPLSWVVLNGLTGAAREMLRVVTHISEIDSPDVTGRTALHECMSLACNGSNRNDANAILAATEIAEELLKVGASVNASSISGRTPLHELFCKGQDEELFATSQSSIAISPLKTFQGLVSETSKHKQFLTRAMLQWGADPLLEDRQGLTPAHHCAKENLVGCMLEILKACPAAAGYMSGNNQRSPLHLACKTGAVEVAQLLIRWDADHRTHNGLLLQRDKQGKVPTQLLPNGSSKYMSKIDNLWDACRSGSLSRVAGVLSKMKSSGGSEGLSSYSESTYFTKESCEWLYDGINSKTRRRRWTAMHACLLGWAEANALCYADRRSSASVTSSTNQSVYQSLGILPRTPALKATSASRIVPTVLRSSHREILLLLLEVSMIHIFLHFHLFTLFVIYSFSLKSHCIHLILYSFLFSPSFTFKNKRIMPVLIAPM